MPNEMNHAEVVEVLENMSSYSQTKVYEARCAALSVVRKVANGKLNPLVHAKWEYLGYIGDHEKWGCKNCHTMSDKESNYCPSCGALMGKDDSHEK